MIIDLGPDSEFEQRRKAIKEHDDKVLIEMYKKIDHMTDDELIKYAQEQFNKMLGSHSDKWEAHDMACEVLTIQEILESKGYESTEESTDEGVGFTIGFKKKS